MTPKKQEEQAPQAQTDKPLRERAREAVQATNALGYNLSIRWEGPALRIYSGECCFSTSLHNLRELQAWFTGFLAGIHMELYNLAYRDEACNRG